MIKYKTLTEFVIERQDEFKYATGELTSILRDISEIFQIFSS